MKKKFVLAILSLSLIAVSCAKEEDDTHTQQTISKATRKQKPKPKPTRDWDPCGGGQVMDCTEAGNNCIVNKAGTEEIEQIGILQTYIDNNKANEYFTTDAWDVLFGNIEDTPGLLNQILANSVKLYQMESTDETKSYVLSSAENKTSINNSNIILVWQY